ncbi:MAG: patatin-like phospholipase family protein [Myxococcota bacterium]
MTETVKFEEILGFLEHVPALRGLDPALRRRLAEGLELKRHGDDASLQRGRPTHAADPLRFIVHGHLLRGTALSAERAGGRIATAGSLVGLLAVDAWARARGLFAGARHGTQARRDLRCHGAVWALELPAARFDDVLGSPDATELREHLLRLVPADVHAPRIVEQLRRQPAYRRADPRALLRVVERSPSRSWRSGDSQPVDAGHLHYVIAGALDIAGDRYEHLVAGELESEGAVPNDERGRPMEAAAGTMTVDIPREDLERVRRGSRPARLPHATDPRALPMVVVLHDPDCAPDEWATEAGHRALVDAMAQPFEERVASLRVVWSTSPTEVPHPLQPPTLLSLDPNEALEHQLARGLMAFARDWGPFFDRVVVDTGAIAETRRACAAVWRTVATLQCPATLAYVIDFARAWAELPRRLGLLPPVELVPTVVLTTPTSAPRPDEPPTPSDSARALGRWLARCTTRRPEATPPTPTTPPWPLDAVRLSPADLTRAQRWARALTSRRVGLAIGGSGIQSLVALPLIRGLAQRGIPIDHYAGTSVGAFIGVLHAARGEAGLEPVEHDWPGLQLAVLHGYRRGDALRRWLAEATHDIDLSALPSPAIVVSTRAETLEAHLHTSGPAAWACLASGSMPPMAPTFIGGRRFVDGVVAADLPAAALRSAGAALVLGVQAMPPVSREPAWATAVQSRRGGPWAPLAPARRFWDFARSYLAFARRAAQSETPHADLVLHGSIEHTLAGFFWQGARIVDDTTRHEDLEHTLNAAEAHWRALTRRSPRRVDIEPDTGRVRTGEAIDLSLSSGVEPRPSADAHALLARLHRWLEHRPDLRLRVTLELDADADPAAYERALETLAPNAERTIERGSGRARLRLAVEAAP